MFANFKRYGEEFKTFAMRGNVIDMAVGIIIGAAFGKIVDSLVNDVIMPPLGWLMGRVDFSKLFFVWKESLKLLDLLWEIQPEIKSETSITTPSIK